MDKKEKKLCTKWKELPLEIRKRKRKKHILIGIAVVLAVVCLAIKATAGSAVMSVNAVTVTRGDVESTVTTSGKVQSDITKVYYSELTGHVGAIPIKQGQAVKNGDVLLYFSEETMAIAHKDAKAATLTSESAYNDTMNQNTKTQAQLTEATVNLEVLEQQITDYKAFVKEQERKYEDTRNRKKADLSEWGMVLSKKQANGENVGEEMADYQYAVETLDMSRELVEIQRTIEDAKEILGNLEEYEAEMKSQKTATEDKVLSAETKEAKELSNEAEQLRNAQMLNYTQSVANGLKADMDGIVTELKVTEGAPISAGAALITVASNEQVHVTVSLSKSDLAKVKEGQKAEVTVAGSKYEGEVSYINHMATLNANNMPVVEAEIAIQNTDENIYLGVEAKVVIYAQKSEDVLLVPVECVNSDKEGDFVYEVENGIVVRKNVMTGVSSDEYIEVVSGLEEKAQVMTDISLTITEGMEVMVVTDLMEENDTDISIETEENAETESAEVSVESE